MDLANNLNRIVNVVLRMATLGSKFALVFLLAKFLGEDEFGLYGIFSATVAYVVMAIGFDFYAYATREIINSNASEWAAKLRDQCIFYIGSYIFFLPVCVLIFDFGLMPTSLLIWFFLLLTVEHFSQEFNRLLIAISRPLQASLVLFLRHGLWAIVAAAVMWLMPDSRNLHFVLGAWLLGGLAALLLAVFFIRDIDRSSLQKPVDWKWIKIGFLVSIPFVISTLSLKAVYTADRYWVEHFNTVEVLASYILFIGLANVIMSFLDASVISFTYPGMVSAAGKNDGKLFVQKFKEMAVQVTVVSLVLAVMVVGLSGYLIEWIGKNSYLNNFDILYWVVLATVIFALSMIPHYGLYAFKDDRSIVFGHILTTPIFFAALYFFQSSIGPLTVPVSMLIAFLFLFFIKSVLFYRAFRSKRLEFFWG